MLSRTHRSITSGALPAIPHLYRTPFCPASQIYQFQPKPSLILGSPLSPQSSRPTYSLQRNFHSTRSARKGITPHSSDPAPPNPQSSNGAIHATDPSPLTDPQYHEHSEHYLNVLMAELERVQEGGSEVEAEYSVCSHKSTWAAKLCRDPIQQSVYPKSLCNR
jgi:frataxin